MMLALGLRLALVAELLILAGIGAALSTLGHGAGTLSAVLLLLFLGWRLLLVIASFLAAGPAPVSAGWGRWFRAVFEEYWVMLKLYLWHHLFPPRCGDDRDVQVVLIHGYLCNAGTWVWMQAALQRAGLRVRCVELDPRYHDIEACLDALDDVLAEVSGPVWLLGHSMGGLIARYYAFETRRPIQGVIAIGAPFRGTCMAGVMGGSEAGPPWPGCQWMTVLNARIAAQRSSTTPIYSLYSDLDNIVSPQSSSVVDDAQCELFPGLGHLALVHDRDVTERCVSLLKPHIEQSRRQSATQEIPPNGSRK